MRAHEAGALHGDFGQHPTWLRPPADVNKLMTELWPQTATKDDGGVLHIGGKPVTELAAEHGTPAYLLDEEDFRARCRTFRTAFAGADVYYAGKAFLSKAIVRMVRPEGRVRGEIRPGGRFVRTTHTGPYDGLTAAYSAVRDYAVDNGHTCDTDWWEVYLDTPDVPRPRTELLVSCRLVEPRHVGSASSQVPTP